MDILESRCEPWFTEASVNTVLTILERCDDAKKRNQHLVKFVKVKKRLEELIIQDLKRPLSSKEEDEFNKLKALNYIILNS